MLALSEPVSRQMTARPGWSALAFLLACAPIWLAHFGVWQARPAALLVVLGVTVLFLRLERRPLSVLGLAPSWRMPIDLFDNFSVGVLIVAIIASLFWLVIDIPWALNPQFDRRLAAMSLASLLYGNSVEELLFRGYSFERLVVAIGHWRAQVVTALLFAVFHVVNGYTWSAALLGTTLASVLFGVVFLRFQSVPAAIGIHVAMNWTRDLLLLDPPTRVTLMAPLSPRPWTGGEQLAAVAIMDGVIAITCVVLWRSVGHPLSAPSQPIAHRDTCRTGPARRG